MDFGQLIGRLLAWLGKYLKTGDLSEDLQAMVIEQFEELEENDKLPAVLLELARSMGLTIEQVTVVVANYLLATADKLMQDEN